MFAKKLYCVSYVTQIIYVIDYVNLGSYYKSEDLTFT